MARLWSCGFELNSATANIESTATLGAASIVTTPVRSGTYSARFTGFTSGARQYLGHNIGGTSNVSGPLFCRAYFYYTTLPSAENTILALSDNINTPRAWLTINASGQIQLRDEDGAIGSPSAALSPSTWHMLELRFDITPPAGSHIVEAKIDTVSLASATNRSISQGVASLRVGGNIGLEAQTVGDWYFDDIAVNDGTGSVQNSWPGPGKIIHLRPNAAGDNTTWAPSAGANYTTVDEITPNDDTDYVRNSTTLNQADDYEVEASGLSSGDTVNLVQIGFRARGETATTNQYQFTVRAKKASGGTISESASINLASTSHVTNSGAAPRNYPLTMYTDPDGAAWTNSTLNTMQIGAKTSVVSTNRVRLSTIWALVEYVPGAGAPTVNKTDFFQFF